jgi:sigma-B regulation protein RsbU (phosphoserine phosphatase)
VISHASTEDKFITAFIGILTPDSGALETVSAGHNPVFLRRAGGDMEELALGGVPLGMLDIDFPYQRETATLERGDRLLLYTDGITEAANDQYQLYDTGSPLKDFMRQHRAESADQFIREMIDDVKKFTGNAPQNDDITALYLMRRQ